MENKIALQEKENGNIKFRKKDYHKALKKWIVSLKNCKLEKTKKELYSNLALVNIYLKYYQGAIMYCDYGLKIITEDNLLNKKLQYRKKIANTELNIEENSKIKISEKHSSCININILKLIKKEGYIHIPINCYTISSNISRFIGVMNVLTCISIFIVSPDKTFVCHLPMSILHHLKITKRILKKKLINNNWTKAIFIGGHKESDTLFKQISFSKTIITLIKSILPKIHFDISKLNIFKGTKILKTVEDEINLRKKNTRFILAIYDCVNKKIITHTDYKTQDYIFYYLQDIYNFELLQYKNTNLIKGEKIIDKYYKL